MNNYVTYEQAKLLNEKGFRSQKTPGLREGYYNHKEELNGNMTDYIRAISHKDEEAKKKYASIAAPKHHEVVTWFFTDKSIWVEVIANHFKECGSIAEQGFIFKVMNNKTGNYFDIQGWLENKSIIFNSPQEAYSAAIDYVLTKIF